MLKCHANEKRCTKDSSRAKDSLLKLILDSRLGSWLEEPLDHSTLFGICRGKSIFAEHHFFWQILYPVNRVVKGLSHWVNVTRIMQGPVGSGVPKGRRRGSACLAWDQRTFDSSGERSILCSSEKDFQIMHRAHSYTLCDLCMKTESASSWKGKDRNIVQIGDGTAAYLNEK